MTLLSQDYEWVMPPKHMKVYKINQETLKSIINFGKESEGA